MGTGVIICGLNGAGKSTLGRALASKLSFHFIDNEELYFQKTDADYCYASARTREEAKRLLLQEIDRHKDFVFACVKGDYGEEIYPLIQHAVVVDVPRDVRLQRVRNRSLMRFGNRMLPGGDLHEREEAFFDMVKSRDENMVEEWVQALNCSVLRLDGTKPVEENIRFIIEQIKL